MKIRTLFISDVHLGSRYAKAVELLEFLRQIESVETIYIIGDFIDAWKLKNGWSWNTDCTLVIRKLLGFVKHGATINYIAGNHDEFLRHFIDDYQDLDFDGINVLDECIHITARGDKYLVLHGDKFDVSVKHAKWLCFLGDNWYDWLLQLNTLVSVVRKLFGLKQYWSLSKAIKRQVKKAVNYVGDFETFLTKYAIENDCKGVICGHIHTADMCNKNNIHYCNTGDWVESMSAIIEWEDGSFELIQGD